MVILDTALGKRHEEGNPIRHHGIAAGRDFIGTSVARAIETRGTPQRCQMACAGHPHLDLGDGRPHIAAEIQRLEVLGLEARRIGVGDVLRKDLLALAQPGHALAHHRKDWQLGEVHG